MKLKDITNCKKDWVFNLFSRALNLAKMIRIEFRGLPTKVRWQRLVSILCIF
jgi:hypothetical protein